MMYNSMAFLDAVQLTVAVCIIFDVLIFAVRNNKKQRSKTAGWYKSVTSHIDFYILYFYVFKNKKFGDKVNDIMKDLKKKRLKKVLCFVLASSCFFSFLAFNTGAVSQDELEELESQQSQLEKEQEEIDKAMEEAKAQIEDKEAYLETIREKMEITEKEIDTLKEKAAIYEENIERLEGEIDANQTEIENDYEVLRNRLKAIYKSGNASSLEIILGAKDFDDFLDKTVIVEAVSKFDKELIDGLNQSIDEKNLMIAETQESKEELLEAEEQENLKLDELSQLEKEGQEIIEELRTQVKEYEEREKEIAEEKQQLIDDIAKWHADYVKEQAAQNQSSSGGSSSGGLNPDSGVGSSVGTGSYPSVRNYLWPAPECTVITSYWGDGRNHKGLDLACYGSAYGKDILAAESGTVIRAYWTDDWASGWGYHIMIDHGDGYATLYAHCSKLLVEVGDYVERGQLIAYVGNTGNSFGAHLHFECWYNGVQYDPAPYLGI